MADFVAVESKPLSKEIREWDRCPSSSGKSAPAYICITTYNCVSTFSKYLYLFIYMSPLTCNRRVNDQDPCKD